VLTVNGTAGAGPGAGTTERRQTAGAWRFAALARILTSFMAAESVTGRVPGSPAIERGPWQA
jgi:hypothetical protein